MKSMAKNPVRESTQIFKEDDYQAVFRMAVPADSFSETDPRRNREFNYRITQ